MVEGGGVELDEFHVLYGSFGAVDHGYTVASRLRAEHPAVPILMLAAKSDLMDRVAGLNAGADYYLTMPFDSRELLACVGALLRRQG